MSVTLNELEVFHEFALAKLRGGSVESFEDLFDLWLLEHPTIEAQADIHAAIVQGFADIKAGGGRSATEATAELLRKHGIQIE